MHRLLVIVGVLIALAVATPAFVFAQEATPAPGDAEFAGSLVRTNIRYVSPFTPDGLNPGLTVTATEEGVCGYPSSNALGRPDAWDCISASDVVYDPCFENPFAVPDAPGEVACFASPFSSDVVVLTLTEPLARAKETDDPAPPPDAGQDATATALEPWDLPWALELANGEQCTLFGGTLTVVAGQVANYGCGGGGMVLGRTDRGEPVWVVSYLAEGDYATTLAEVATAWS